MVFYVSLFLVSFVVASVAVWLYRAIEQATRKRYRAFLPSAKSTGAGRPAQRRQVTRADEGVKTPWGWKKPANAVAGRQSFAGGARSNVGWPYRKEPFEALPSRSLGESGPGAKVVGARKISKGGIEKPWGW